MRTNQIEYPDQSYFKDIKIDPKWHHKHAWVVHPLMHDFELEDAWRFPIVLNEDQKLQDFTEVFKNSIQELEQKGIAGALFKLRRKLGDWFGWDEKETTDHPALAPNSLRERYLISNRLFLPQLPAPGSLDFIPVYQLEKESLSEIENATVHAGIHFSIVPISSKEKTIQMVVYTKPKGLLGFLYMNLIKPFRSYIVYPALMKMVKHKWEKSLPHNLQTN